MPKKKTVPRNPDEGTSYRDLIIRIARESPHTLTARAHGFTGEEMLRALEVKAASCDENGRWVGKVDAETREVLRAIKRHEVSEARRGQKNLADTPEGVHLRPVLRASAAVASHCDGVRRNRYDFDNAVAMQSESVARSLALPTKHLFPPQQREPVRCTSTNMSTGEVTTTFMELGPDDEDEIYLKHRKTLLEKSRAESDEFTDRYGWLFR